MPVASFEDITKPKTKVPSFEELTRPVLGPPDMRTALEQGEAAWKLNEDLGIALEDADDIVRAAYETSDPRARLQIETDRRRYQGFFDELGKGLERGGERGISGVMGTGAALLRYLAGNVPESEKNTMLTLPAGVSENIAQSLYEDAQRWSVQPGEGGGIKGFVAATLGDTLPLFASATVATVAAGPAGAWTVTAMSEGDNAYRQAVADGASPEQAELTRVVVGSVNGVIEMAQVGHVLRLGKRATDQTAKRFAREVSESALKRIAQRGGRITVDVVKSAVQEGFEEVAQGWVGDGSATLIYGKDFNLQQRLEASKQEFVGGATAGILLGGGSLLLNGALAQATKPAEGGQVQEEGGYTPIVQPMAMTEEEYAREIATQEAAAALPAEAPAPVVGGEAAIETPAPQVTAETPETVAESATVQGQAKQPWEMTKEEVETVLRGSDLAARRPVIQALFPDIVNREAPDPKGGDFSTSLWGEVNEPSRYGEGRVPFPWVAEAQRTLLKEAVQQGRPVPRTVLEEYANEPWAAEALAKMGPEAAPGGTEETATESVTDQGQVQPGPSGQEPTQVQTQRSPEAGGTAPPQTRTVTISFGPGETLEAKLQSAIQQVERQLRPVLEAEIPSTVEGEGPKRQRQFIESLKEADILKPTETAEYRQRSTSDLAVRAANLVQDDIAQAEKIARTRTDDVAVAVISELLKEYGRQARAAESETIRDTIYEKTSALAYDAAARLTEAGRIVQAASIVSLETPEGLLRFAAREINAYNEKHPKNPLPKLTKEQVAFILKEIDGINGMPPGIEKAIRFEKLMDHIRGLVPSSTFDKIVTLWKAGLLTGIKTSGLNTISNAMHGVTEVVKDIPAAAVDSVLSLFSGKRTLALTLRGSWTGIQKGARAGWTYMRTGFSERDIAAKLDWKKVQFKSKTGKFFQAYEELVFHTLGAEDQPFYYGAKARSLASQAEAIAKTEKLRGTEYTMRINGLLENPTDEMLKYATIDAETAVFQNRTKLGDIARQMQTVKGIEFIIPFARTPSAIAMQMIHYSPLGAIKAVVENMGNYDQRLFSQQIGRAVVGTGVLVLGAHLFRAGLMMLGRPRTEKERELWKLEGRAANSIKIGGQWRSVQVLGPAGLVMVVGGYFAQALDETGSPTKAMVTSFSGGAKAFTEQTYLRGLNSALEAIQEPENYGPAFFSSMAGSVVPTLLADIARATDTTERRSAGPLTRAFSRIPGLRQTLEPQVNVFGNDLPRYGGNALEVMADPTRPAKIHHDVVVDELRRLWDAGHRASPTLLGSRNGFDGLTAAQNTELWRRAGELTYYGIWSLLGQPLYRYSDDSGKTRLLNQAVEDAKIRARAEMAYQLIQAMPSNQRMRKIEALRDGGLVTNEVARQLEIYP